MNTPEENVCRRCDNADYKYGLTEGLCKRCQLEAGLVRCEICGRLLPREVAIVERQTPKETEYLCPPCYKEYLKERVIRRGIDAGTHRADGSVVQGCAATLGDASGKPCQVPPASVSGKTI